MKHRSKLPSNASHQRIFDRAGSSILTQRARSVLKNQVEKSYQTQEFHSWYNKIPEEMPNK